MGSVSWSFSSLGERIPQDRIANLIRAIREILHRQWEVKVNHVYLEGNRIADFMANRDFEIESNV
ncbi:Ribonuclease H domain - like 10 [Theobroma cacao]|nr:Ribonuclease H domain - like 10 [Theobroma cacao]